MCNKLNTNAGTWFSMDGAEETDMALPAVRHCKKWRAVVNPGVTLMV